MGVAQRVEFGVVEVLAPGFKPYDDTLSVLEPFDLNEVGLTKGRAAKLVQSVRAANDQPFVALVQCAAP